MALAQVRQAHVEAAAAVQAHEAGMTAECHFAGKDLDALATFTTWASNAARFGNTLRQRRADLARSEDAAHGALHEAFVGLKRLELALEGSVRAASAASRRRADAAAEERQQIRSAAEAV
ncbi:MAG: hypothetical protein B7Z80_03005 [Rhodospirillales bacterium 20-64-7]|nr:MAG: hypothetical protein B7Z80_03005 [Rhodospirillales bacterium 20-64-7]